MKKIRIHFHWDGMNKKVKDYVNSCLECQKNTREMKQERIPIMIVPICSFVYGHNWTIGGWGGISVLFGINRQVHAFLLLSRWKGSIPKRPIAKTAPTKTAPKILISKQIVQNGPLHCPKRPIAKSKTAHSYIQNGPLSLSAFGNVQSDVEILYVEVSYTRVKDLDDSESQMFGHALWCNLLQVQVCERKEVLYVKLQRNISHTNLIMNPTYD